MGRFSAKLPELMLAAICMRRFQNQYAAGYQSALSSEKLNMSATPACDPGSPERIDAASVYR